MQRIYRRDTLKQMQWEYVIDKALELGCAVKFGKYGDVCAIDCSKSAKIVARAKLGKNASELDMEIAQNKAEKNIFDTLERVKRDDCYRLVPVASKGNMLNQVFFSMESAMYTRDRLQESTKQRWLLEHKYKDS